MTFNLADAAVDLADVLARENEALKRWDLPRVASMLAAKQRAVRAFVAARECAPRHAGRRGQKEALIEVGERLNALAAENRRLLGQAARVQGRVIEVIAGALARTERSGYGAGGTATPPRVSSAGFSTRA